MNALASLDPSDPVQAELDAAKLWLQDFTLNALDRQHAVLAHYLGALVQRAQGQDGRVRRLLLEKFSAKKQTLLDSLSAALQGAAGRDAAVALAPHSDTLAGLTQRLDQLRHIPTENIHNIAMGSRQELRSVISARSTWSRLGADKQLKQAQLQAPKNAGPLNSHRVALQALTAMRELSPDYFHRFITVIDTLVALEPSRAPAAQRQKVTKAKPIDAQGKATNRR